MRICARTISSMAVKVVARLDPSRIKFVEIPGARHNDVVLLERGDQRQPSSRRRFSVVPEAGNRASRTRPNFALQFYAAASARDDGMRAGFEYFRNFEQDAKD
jgi:hypothetical protein